MNWICNMKLIPHVHWSRWYIWYMYIHLLTMGYTLSNIIIVYVIFMVAGRYVYNLSHQPRQGCNYKHAKPRPVVWWRSTNYTMNDIDFIEYKFVFNALTARWSIVDVMVSRAMSTSWINQVCNFGIPTAQILTCLVTCT